MLPAIALGGIQWGSTVAQLVVKVEDQILGRRLHTTKVDRDRADLFPAQTVNTRAPVEEP